jgi:transcription antitermination factor NusG
VQTRTRWEQPSATLLAEKGYEVFCPSRKGKGSTEQPLFPSYLFCRSTAASLGRIVNTPGVLRLLGRPGHPESVPDAEIASVRRLVETGLPTAGDASFTPGSQVRVCRGPLSGVVGKVVGKTESRQLAVSVPILQRSVSVALDPSWLESASARELAS